MQLHGLTTNDASCPHARFKIRVIAVTALSAEELVADDFRARDYQSVIGSRHITRCRGAVDDAANQALGVARRQNRRRPAGETLLMLVGRWSRASTHCRGVVASRRRLPSVEESSPPAGRPASRISGPFPGRSSSGGERRVVSLVVGRAEGADRASAEARRRNYAWRSEQGG